MQVLLGVPVPVVRHLSLLGVRPQHRPLMAISSFQEVSLPVAEMAKEAEEVVVGLVRTSGPAATVAVEVAMLQVETVVQVVQAASEAEAVLVEVALLPSTPSTPLVRYLM